MRLLDPQFEWVPSVATDVSATWRRFGFRPVTQEERAARQRASGACFPKPDPVGLIRKKSAQTRTEETPSGEGRRAPLR